MENVILYVILIILYNL